MGHRVRLFVCCVRSLWSGEARYKPKIARMAPSSPRIPARLVLFRLVQVSVRLAPKIGAGLPRRTALGLVNRQIGPTSLLPQSSPPLPHASFVKPQPGLMEFGERDY
jgi:hypothetical protein